MTPEHRYEYEALTVLDSIRLLRLSPSKDKDAPILCEILHDALDEATGQLPFYEALSYVWGSSEKSHSIVVHGRVRRQLAVTRNLSEALLHLRHHSIERVIWVDAICINQEDKSEKERQIRLMYKVYAHASCVLVWLGKEANEDERVLEELRIIASKKATGSLQKEMIQGKVAKLLQRDWFRRIWVRALVIDDYINTNKLIQVLQEVSAARRVQVLCGNSSIDGYAFCLGVDSMGEYFDAHKDLQALQRAVRPVTYLMRGAIFRPSYRSLDIASEGICSMGGLMDMFCAHQASEPRDKVYALLGMSSDDVSQSNILPDYQVPFDELLKRLVTFVLSEAVHVDTRGSTEAAVIRGKGCILGRISQVEERASFDNTQRVKVYWRDLSGLTECFSFSEAPWTLQDSARTLRCGDFVCLLKNATAPTVIRACKDFADILIVPPWHEAKLPLLCPPP